MKTTRVVLLSLLFLCTFAAAGFAATITAGVRVGPSGGATVDLGFFYDDLASYGNWVERPSYGWVWRPRSVASSWRPYTEGHWALTDDGWTWISEEPYGWATYHYGRWYLDPDYGWEWVPGDEWAPAWVSWQEGGDYVGWAPLPPSVQWSGGGFGGVDFSAAISPDAYIFVPERQFLAPRIVTYIVPRERVVNVYRQTRNITNYRVVDRRVVNQGIPVERVQQVIGRPVPHYQIGDLGANQRHQGGRVQANRVAFFRPQVEKTAKVAPPSERPAARQAVVRPGAPNPAQANRGVPPGQARRERPGRAPQAQPQASAPQAQQPEARPRGRAPRADRQPPQNAAQQPPQNADRQAPPRARRQQQQENPAPPSAERRDRPAARPTPPARPAPPEARPSRPQQQGRPQPQASPDNRPRGQGQGKPADRPRGGKPKDKPQPPPPSSDR